MSEMVASTISNLLFLVSAEPTLVPVGCARTGAARPPIDVNSIATSTKCLTANGLPHMFLFLQFCAARVRVHCAGRTGVIRNIARLGGARPVFRPISMVATSYPIFGASNDRKEPANRFLARRVPTNRKQATRLLLLAPCSCDDCLLSVDYCYDEKCR